jgi:hypothetical protein
MKDRKSVVEECSALFKLALMVARGEVYEISLFIIIIIIILLLHFYYLYFVVVHFICLCVFRICLQIDLQYGSSLISHPHHPLIFHEFKHEKIYLERNERDISTSEILNDVELAYDIAEYFVKLGLLDEDGLFMARDVKKKEENTNRLKYSNIGNNNQNDNEALKLFSCYDIDKDEILEKNECLVGDSKNERFAIGTWVNEDEDESLANNASGTYSSNNKLKTKISSVVSSLYTFLYPGSSSPPSTSSSRSSSFRTELLLNNSSVNTWR